MDEPLTEPQNDLTGKEQKFISAYVGEARFNATKAAIMAGYGVRGARTEGWRLLRNADIRTRIDAILESEALTAAEILHELRATALAPTTHFMQTIMPEQTDMNGNVIAPMVVRQDYGAKLKALELLGKNRKLFAEQVEHSGNVSFTDLAAIAGEADAPGSAGDPSAGG